MRRFVIACGLLLSVVAGCTNTPVPKGDLTSQAGGHEAKYVTLTATNFEKEVLESSEPVLVDFWAPWCGPCLKLGPTIDTVANEYQGRVKVAKIDIDSQEAIALKYNVEMIPLLIVFKDGKEVVRKNVAPGASANGEIKKLLDQAL